MSPDAARQLADTGPDAGFWAGLDIGAFRVQRCAACRTWIWPAQPRCGTCGSFDPVWTDVAMDGTVYSWTRTWYPFVPERAADLPYVVVVIELPQAGGSRMMGVLTGDEAGLGRGARVVGRLEAPSERTLGLASVTWSLSAQVEGGS